jgi:hypothetical protein
MFIETIPNRGSPPAILIRESRREGEKVLKETIANVSKLPPSIIDGLRGLLKGGLVLDPKGEMGGLRIERSLPHGHVAAALGMVRKINLDRLLLSTAKDDASQRKCALIVAVSPDTACTSLGEVLALGEVGEREAYEALDWLLGQQRRIEGGLARRHLQDGSLVLYDLSSSYFEGRKCPLAKHGYSRDHRGDRPQIVYGLMCTRDGLPVAVEVFEGNTADPATIAMQVLKLKDRFKLERVVLVGDRGMLTSARITQDLKPAGIDWVSCLRAKQIQALAEGDGPLQLSLFDERDLAEISAPDLFPGERLVVCRNPLLAAERTRKRGELLAATEAKLTKFQEQLARKSAAEKTDAKIGLKIGSMLGRHKMAKHFKLDIKDGTFSFHRNALTIEREARLDGIYVIRTSLPAETMSADEAVVAYKDLARVERAFRSIKTTNLEVRPIRHWTPDRVRAHVLLCMLAYHVEWHLRQALAPLLFHDTDLEAAKAQRASPVAKTLPSDTARMKKATKTNPAGETVMAFSTLMDHLATMTHNTVQADLHGKHSFTMIAKPTPTQKAAFQYLDFEPSRVQ